MKKLIVSPSPHLLSGNSTSNIMFDMIVALFQPGGYIFVI